MIYVELPTEVAAEVHRLPFYLSMEEHLARNYTGEYFVMWRVNPTVIFGRNQDPRAEVNLGYCRENGIQFYRRKSGGGCVYADLNNIMTAVISSSTRVESTFADYCHRIAGALRELGLNADASGRNDVMIDGRKVSGNSFHHMPQRSIVHGTMLYDADVATMQRALTPSEAKLKSKGVSSVRSRITTIREHLPELSLADFSEHLRRSMSTGVITLSADDVAEIRRIEAPYYTPEWIFEGRGSVHDIGKKGVSADATPSAGIGCETVRELPRVRIEGAGEFAPRLHIAPDGAIASAELPGDYFPLTDIGPGMLDCLRGVRPERRAIEAALAHTDVSQVIAGLTNEKLITLLLP